MEMEGWDTTQSLKWGFFFFGKNEDYLKGIYSELADHNYKIEELFKNEDGEWVLQVSKIEAMPSDKLFRRCIAFNELAETYNSYYDGWDVGKNV